MWLRWMAVFCMALIGVASTAQVCHSHDEDARITVALSAQTQSVSAQASVQTGLPDNGDQHSAPDSAVRCPLCVAMHAALPVLTSLPQVALMRVARPVAPVDSMERTFSWRFEMASRPPPATALAA
ncbi:hypothetical protein GRAN_2150 [Granulicella sibirica]|uniref:DUF2946 domain-containing protein n=2 Tax=Granulicella sibirica TaxID=2479048 RepID=A0A4Q0T7Z2_9BACT|nr:hypothetical protein GRAN_2150 [Granulicella sibirica]